VLDAIVGALIGSLITILGVWWTVRVAIRVAAEARIADALERLAEVTRRNINYIEGMIRDNYVTGALDEDLWREQRRECVGVAIKAKYSYPGFSSCLIALYTRYDLQLRDVTWKGEPDPHLDKVQVSLWAISLAISAWEENMRLFRVRKVLPEYFVSNAKTLIYSAQTGLRPVPGGEGITLMVPDENFRNLMTNPRRRKAAVPSVKPGQAPTPRPRRPKRPRRK
jgi:hypothetical protein